MPTTHASESALPVEVYIGLGANLGDRFAQLQWAVTELARHPAIDLRAVSPVYEGPAHTLTPGEQQPPYLNAVVYVRTLRPASALLADLLALERRAGRERDSAPRWAPRTLDLDLLLYGNLTLDTPGLSLPHPRLGERRFVLCPLADLAPNLYVPMPYDTTVQELLDRCPDPFPLARTSMRLHPGAPTPSPS